MPTIREGCALARHQLTTRETIRRLIRQGARRPGDEVGRTAISWPATEAAINRITLDPNILSELRHVLNTLSDRGEPLREFRDQLMRAADAREADVSRIARPGEKIAAPFQAASLALVVALIGFLLLDRIHGGRCVSVACRRRVPGDPFHLVPLPAVHAFRPGRSRSQEAGRDDRRREGIRTTRVLMRWYLAIPI